MKRQKEMQNQHGGAKESKGEFKGKCDAVKDKNERINSHKDGQSTLEMSLTDQTQQSELIKHSP